MARCLPAAYLKFPGLSMGGVVVMVGRSVALRGGTDLRRFPHRAKNPGVAASMVNQVSALPDRSLAGLGKIWRKRRFHWPVEHGGGPGDAFPGWSCQFSALASMLSGDFLI